MVLLVGVAVYKPLVLALMDQGGLALLVVSLEMAALALGELHPPVDHLGLAAVVLAAVPTMTEQWPMLITEALAVQAQ